MKSQSGEVRGATSVINGKGDQRKRRGELDLFSGTVYTEGMGQPGIGFRAKGAPDPDTRHLLSKRLKDLNR